MPELENVNGTGVLGNGVSFQVDQFGTSEAPAEKVGLVPENPQG
jgi:hypothetical protein